MDLPCATVSSMYETCLLMVSGLRWRQHNEEEVLALRMLRGEIRAPKPLWLGRASILHVDRGCLLATSGGTDALVALNSCLRSQEDLLCVANWTVNFLARAIDFLIGAVEQGIFPGSDWTLRQCCVGGPVPGPPSELVLVDVKGLRHIADVRRRTAKLRRVWQGTVEEYLLVLSTAPRVELRQLSDYVSTVCPQAAFHTEKDVVPTLQRTKELLQGALGLWALQLGVADVTEVVGPSWSTRGLSQDSGHMASAAAVERGVEGAVPPQRLSSEQEIKIPWLASERRPPR